MLVTKAAPDFKAQAVMEDNSFKEISLSDFKGKKFVVTEFYFDGKYQCKIINSKYE